MIVEGSDDEEALHDSYTNCEECCDPIALEDTCVMLKLVYPAQEGIATILLDALEADGDYMADPLFFCGECWDSILENLQEDSDDLFLRTERADNPSTERCCICSKYVEWGGCVAQIVQGRMSVSPRTKETCFLPDRGNSLIVCMDCLAHLNDTYDQGFWTHLWEED